MDEKEYYIWIGSKLRELREREGLKQKDVAAKAKMSAQFLSNVENYGKKVSIFQLDLILQAIGKTMFDLFENADEEKKKLTLTLNGDEIGQLSNGEKMAFAEKVKLFFKVAFSEQMAGAVEGAAYDQAVDQLFASKEYLIFGWAIIIGIITSGVSGFITAHFAKHAPYLHNGIVLGLGILVNLLSSSGEGPASFSPLEALLLLGAELFFRYLGLTFAMRNVTA